jgi:hypothetical protein
MASAYLSGIQAVNNTQAMSSSADSALSAFEKDMFGGSAHGKEHEQAAHEVDPGSLSYLFAIFAY